MENNLSIREQYDRQGVIEVKQLTTYPDMKVLSESKSIYDIMVNHKPKER